MLDIVTAHDEEPLARPHHQGLDDGKALVGRRPGDAGHAEAAGEKAGAADHGQNQQKGAEIPKEIDEPVPPEHFKAVAQVIGYVLRLKGKLPARAS